MKMKFALGKEDRDIQLAFRRTVDCFIRGKIASSDAEAYLISRLIKHPHKQWEVLFPELAQALGRLGRIEKNEPSSFGKGLWSLFEWFLQSAYKKNKALALWAFVATTETFPRDNWVGKNVSRKLGQLWEGHTVSEDRVGFFFSCRIEQESGSFRIKERNGWASARLSPYLKMSERAFSPN